MEYVAQMLAKATEKVRQIGEYEMGTQTWEANELLLFLVSGDKKLLKELDNAYEETYKFITNKNCESYLNVRKKLRTIEVGIKSIEFSEMYAFNDVYKALFKRTRWFLENLYKAYKKQFDVSYFEITGLVLENDLHNWLYREFEVWLYQKVAK